MAPRRRFPFQHAVTQIQLESTFPVGHCFWMSPLPGPTMRHVDTQTYWVPTSPMGSSKHVGCSDTSAADPGHLKVIPPSQQE